MSLRFNPFTGTLDFDTTSSAAGLWVSISDTVSASSSKVVDQTSLAGLNSATYRITIYNLAQSVTKTFEMVINNANGSLRDTVKGKIGSNINYSIDAGSNLGNMDLTITNNEAFNLEVSMAKLTL